MYTADDLKPGLVLKARKQGTCITPQTIEITVRWVYIPDEPNLWSNAVYYTVKGSGELRNTPIARFLEIVNQ